MKTISILAEVIRHPDGTAVKGEVVEVSDRSADYLIANGYAEEYIAELNKKVIKKKRPISAVKGKHKKEG